MLQSYGTKSPSKPITPMNNDLPAVDFLDDADDCNLGDDLE